jgi:hypothetical protein
MPTSFKYFAFVIGLCTLLFSCQQETINPLPPVEKKGNVFALFEPGQPLQLQAAITGYELDEIRPDQASRITSILYKNGQLQETFNLTGNVAIELGQNYELRCQIDNNYIVRGSISLPADALTISQDSLTELSPPLLVPDENGRVIRLNFERYLSINVPVNFSSASAYLSQGLPGSMPFYDTAFFDLGQRINALPKGEASKLSVKVNSASDTVKLFAVNQDFYQYMLQLRNPVIEQEVVPGNVSVNNMIEGTGLMAYQIEYLSF